jgi:malate dehydrogenase (oxaloacetate-decarboxylating)(NADP+)
MQGTSVVALAGIIGALRAIQHSKGIRQGNTAANIQNVLKDQRIVLAGAGTAGLGVSSGIIFAMQAAGLTEAEARERFWILDDKGLLGAGRTGENEFQTPWIRSDYPDRLSLLETISQVKPTVLLGLTGVTSLFTEPAIREMSKHVDHPIIFPLSNPTDKAECKAREAYIWSEGRCIFASGSPFDPVEYGGKRYKPGQANNFYSFPVFNQLYYTNLLIVHFTDCF